MGHTAHILLIDDSPERARMIAAALGQIDPPHHLTRASSPEQALALLEDRERFSRRNPDLILADLRLPFDLLQKLKTNPLYRSIPLAMLTNEAANARLAYDMHANVVVRKPETAEEIETVLDSLCNLFLKVAIRPVPGE